MQTPYTTPTNPMPEEHKENTVPEKSSAGPLIGATIIIVVLALGAFYFWGAHLNTVKKANDGLPLIPAEGADTTSDANQEWMPQDSSSDNAADIQADLEATDMSTFEQQMNADMEATNSGL